MQDGCGGSGRWTAVGIVLLLSGIVAGLVGLRTDVAAQGNLPAQRARPTTSNRITTENALPGTDTWTVVGNYNINALAAYAGATSVNAGDPISIAVQGSGSSLSAVLYRLGYYGDHGARQYATYSGIPITTHTPTCPREAATGLVQCAWNSFSIPTDPTWISGIYLLRLDSNNGFRFFVYFTVRNDSYNADIVVSESSKTNEAYNRYGGESLYFSGNGEGRARAYKVSFDRPYDSGAGTGSFFVHDVDMVRWLEASGYDVTYISDVDRIANPNILRNHRVYLDVGHDEYWSWGERDNVESALAAGVNIAFASGNESYWNIRTENAPSGANRIIVCYKDNNLDPMHTAPNVTVTFDDPLLNRPENALVGVSYESYYDDVLYNAPWVLSAPPDRWYFDCTGLQVGDQVNNVVGEEWDGFRNNGRAPAGLELLSTGSIIGNNGRTSPQNSTIYTTTNGSRVFAAASIHWSWGMIDHSSRVTSVPTPGFQTSYLSNDADHRLEQLMANVLDNFAGYWNGQPRGCGPGNQSFYDVGSRPTRTPRPLPATATGTPWTVTPTNTATRTQTPLVTPTRTQTPLVTPTRTRTSTATNTAISTATPTRTQTATNTPTRTATPTDTPTLTPTATNTPILTVTLTYTPPATGTPTWTRTPTATNTPILTTTPTITPTGPPAATATASATATNTATLPATVTPPATGTPTATSIPPTLTATPAGPPAVTATASATATNTATLPATVTPPATGTPTATSPPLTSTATPVTPPTFTTTGTAAPATATDTPSVAPTGTPPVTATPPLTTPSATATSLPPSATATAWPTGQPSGTATAVGLSVTPTAPSATATVCTIRFSDVADTTAYYYASVYYLACRGVISGYSDGTFRPYNNTTRGQLAKIVVLAYAIPLVTPPAEGARTFSDVTPDNVFYGLIETAAARSLVSGYTCGGSNPQTGAAELCDAAQRPYYRPGNNVTRGQLTKIVVIGAGWALRTPVTATFSDVPAGNVFYPFIETAVCHGIISGYNDGTFRPTNAATRGQIAKIVYGALTSPAACGP